MGRNLSCDESTRKIIITLVLEKKWTYQKVADHLKCSKTLVFNAVKHFKTNQTWKNVERRKRPRKSSPRTDAKIVRLSKKNPKLTSTDIKRDLFGDSSTGLAARTIRKRLNEANLFGRVARKKPLAAKRTRDARMKFAQLHQDWTMADWKHVLWSDETKINRIGSDGRQYVRRPPKTEFNPRYTELTVKHGGGNIKLWGCFSYHGVGPLVKIDGIMDQHKYKSILEDTMLPYAEENLSVLWKFQQDNDPKHTAKTVKHWITSNSINLLEWPSCSPDLNPIENLWNDVKRSLVNKNITNLDQLYQEALKSWQSIPVERCQRLVESMPRRCAAVLQNKGFPTKY